MICIKDLVNSKLFKYPECRAILLPVFCQQIKDKLESKEEVSFPAVYFYHRCRHKRKIGLRLEAKLEMFHEFYFVI